MNTTTQIKNMQNMYKSILKSYLHDLQSANAEIRLAALDDLFDDPMYVHKLCKLSGLDSKRFFEKLYKLV